MFNFFNNCLIRTFAKNFYKGPFLFFQKKKIKFEQ